MSPTPFPSATARLSSSARRHGIAATAVATAVVASVAGGLVVTADARPVADPAATRAAISYGTGADVGRALVALGDASAPSGASSRTAPEAAGAWVPAATPDASAASAGAANPAAPTATAASASAPGTPASPAPAAAASSASAPAASASHPTQAAPAAPTSAPTTSQPAPTTAAPAPRVALSLTINRSGANQALIDACAGPVLWGAGGGYPPAGLVGQHNYCGGGAFMGLGVGDIVQVSGLSAGTYRVQRTMVIPGRSNAYAGQFGNADMALQTCTWDNQSYFYALLVRA